MQITINTDTDDLPAVIRMLQAYGGHQGTMALVADVKELTKKVEATAQQMGIIKSGPNHMIEGVKPGGIYTGEALKAALAAGQDHVDYAPPTIENYVGRAGGSGGGSAHADEPEEPTPEQVFAAPKSLFDSVPDVAAAGRAMAAELAKGPSVTVSDVTVDAAGLPWDARIHSGAKSKLANGNWKLLRGVDPALVSSVEAELRGTPKPAEVATDPSPAPVPPAPPVAPPPPATAPASATPAPAAPSAPPIPPAPATPKPITNAAELVAAVMDKRFTTDQVNAACQAVGVENVASLLAKQDKLPAVLKELGV